MYRTAPALSDNLSLSPPTRVMFMWLVRRGSRLPVETVFDALTIPGLDACAVVSNHADSLDEMRAIGDRLVVLNMFEKVSGAATHAWRIPLLRRQLAREIKARQIEAVVDIWPHVWASALYSAIQGAGARYVPIVHDGRAHPGDWTGLFKPLFNRAHNKADRLITLSQSVTDILISRGVDRSRIAVLPFPQLTYGVPLKTAPRTPSEPLRFIFFGRVYKYKGLKLFVDAVEMLRARGKAFSASVVGSGDYGAEAERLAPLGVDVINRWLSDSEMGAAINAHDVAVLPYIEASQSAVVVAAFGIGLPVIATPVGGLVEQIDNGVNGLITQEVSAASVAERMEQLIDDRARFEHLFAGVQESRNATSTRRFAYDCARIGTGRL